MQISGVRQQDMQASGLKRERKQKHGAYILGGIRRGKGKKLAVAARGFSNLVTVVLLAYNPHSSLYFAGQPLSHEHFQSWLAGEDCGCRKGTAT